MAKSKTTFLADVASSLRSKADWRHRLPQDVLDELDEVRANFRQGLLLGKPYQVAAAIIKTAKARNLTLPGEKAVVKWLKSDD